MLKRFFTKFLMQFEYLFIEIQKKKSKKKKRNRKLEQMVVCLKDS